MIDLDELMALLIDVPEMRSRNVVTRALIAELRAAHRRIAELEADKVLGTDHSEVGYGL